jgi:hypothetical protein
VPKTDEIFLFAANAVGTKLPGGELVAHDEIERLILKVECVMEIAFPASCISQTIFQKHDKKISCSKIFSNPASTFNACILNPKLSRGITKFTSTIHRTFFSHFGRAAVNKWLIAESSFPCL